MHTWYKKELGIAMRAADSTEELFAALKSYESVKGLPINAAILGRYDRNTDLITAYFTPEADEFAERLGAEPCAMPVQDGRLTFCAGDRDGFDFHYGGEAGHTGRDDNRPQG